MIAERRLSGSVPSVRHKEAKPSPERGEKAFGGGGDQCERDDAHAFRGVIHAVAEAHVGGTAQLQLAEQRLTVTGRQLRRMM